MQQFEYLVITTNIGGYSPDEDLTTQLNTQAQTGWRLVHMSRKNDDWTAIYERPVAANEPTE